MNRDEAMQCASGYAWGREDGTGTATVVPEGTADTNGSWVFARAFADGYEDYNSEARSSMVNVRAAYERWQGTRGQSIFPEGDSTAEQRARHEEYRRTHG